MTATLWTDIIINGRKPLDVLVSGSMASEWYSKEVLRARVCSFRGNFGDIFLYMNDNVACHCGISNVACLMWHAQPLCRIFLTVRIFNKRVNKTGHSHQTTENGVRKLAAEVRV